MNLLSILLLAVPGQAVVPADVAALEKATLDYRRTIQRGQLVLTKKEELNGAPAPERDRTTTIWFDGKQIRSDTVYRQNKDDPVHREVRCRNCEFNDYYILFPQEEVKGGKVALALHSMQEGNPSPEAYPVLDPRLLGMVVDYSPQLALSYWHLDSFVARPGREQITMRREIWKGMDCRRIEYILPPTSSVRIWIVQDWGPSVGRIETEDVVNGHHHFDSVESDYQQIGDHGLWFPLSCTRDSYFDSKDTEKEVVNVQVTSLNEPISPDVFRMKGMNIPVGWPIAGFRNEGFSYWNGKEVVPEDPSPHGPPLAAAPSLAARWPYAVAAITLAVIGMVSLGWYMLRKKPARPPTKV